MRSLIGRACSDHLNTSSKPVNVQNSHDLQNPLGNLRAINPENGFFGVAPGTSIKTNPNAMKTIQKNTIFTNVGETSDGGVYWEGIDKQLPPGVTLTSWKNKEWTTKSGKKTVVKPTSFICVRLKL